MTLNEILGEAACRKLTEFSGEKEHVTKFHSTDVQGGSGDGYYYCSCGKTSDNYPVCKETSFDFSDPRVWTRLIEKVDTFVSLRKWHDKEITCSIGECGSVVVGEGETNAEAVCRAVLALIEEGEK